MLSLSSRPALCVVSPLALKCYRSPQRQALHAGDAVPGRAHGGRQCGREKRLRQWVLPGPPLLRLRLQHMHLFSTTLPVHAEEAGRAACTGTGESSLSVNLAVAPSIRGKGPKHPADDTYALFLPAPQHFSGKFCAKGSIAVEFSMSGLFILICCAWGQGRAG